MKKILKLLPFIFLFLSGVCMLVTLGYYLNASYVRNSWKKGNWPAFIKSNITHNCINRVTDRMMALSAKSKTRLYCECMTDKLEEKYSPAELDLNSELSAYWFDFEDHKNKGQANPWMIEQGKMCFRNASEKENQHHIDPKGKKWNIIEINTFYYECTSTTSRSIEDGKLENFKTGPYCECLTERLSSEMKYSEISTITDTEKKELSLNCKLQSTQ